MILGPRESLTRSTRWLWCYQLHRKGAGGWPSLVRTIDLKIISKCDGISDNQKRDNILLVLRLIELGSRLGVNVEVADEEEVAGLIMLAIVAGTKAEKAMINQCNYIGTQAHAQARIKTIRTLEIDAIDYDGSDDRDGSH